MADLWQQILFWIFAVTMAGSGLRVVTTNNVVHAALYLVVTLMGAGLMYVLLFAEFLAWVQVLVYVGAVVVLMLFGLMLTRAPLRGGDLDNDQRGIAAVTALALFVVLTLVLVPAFDGQEIDLARTTGTKTATVGEVIFADYVLPFEAVSVLLLAALVGAVVVARRDDERTG
ncbi:MAG: NADH-quinone oxidoreductase subunit J [Actinomycetota bacterium]